MSRPDDEVMRFIAASLPSVWALEVLLLLRQERRPWPVAELVASLRASDLVVSKALDALVAGGLAAIEQEGARFLPASKDIEECVDRTEQLYRSRPNAVRRAIVSARSSSAEAFANAFRLRGGRE